MQETLTPSDKQTNSENLPTACVLCSNNCGLLVNVSENKITKVRSDDNNPFSNGYICNKAYRIAHYVEHKQRLEQPLKRTADGGHEPISWEQAATEIGQKLQKTGKEHGSNSIAAVGVGGQGNHLGVGYALATIFGFGSQWWFNALAQEKTQRSLVDSWMCRSPTDVMLVGHLEESDCAIIFGSNPIVSHRGPEANRMVSGFKKSDERTLIVVDPRQTETSKADRHLPIKVGTDTYLLLALAAIIIQEKLYDKQFIEKSTLGIQEVAAAFKDVDVSDMARRCGLETETIYAVAREFAAAGRAAIEVDLGLEQSLFNTLTAYLIRLIMALTNNYGRPGGSVFVGTLVPHIPKFIQSLAKTPKAPVSGLPGISLFAPLPMFSPALFAEEVLSEKPGCIRAAIVDGSNPLLTYPESAQIRKAFAALDVSVVIETSMTETARAADYVLPTNAGYEKWEYSVFPKPFPFVGAQIRPPVVSGQKDARHESEIYHQIALKAKLVSRAPAIFHKLAAGAGGGFGALLYLGLLFPIAFIRARFSKRTIPMVLFWIYETLGPRLKAPQLAVFWLTCQSVAFTRRKQIIRARPEAAKIKNPAKLGNYLYELALAHPEGVVYAKTDTERCLEEHIGYSDGRVRLAPQAMLKEIQRALEAKTEIDTDFPFILNGGMRTTATANTNFRDPQWRKGDGPHCSLRMSIEDAEQLELNDGDRVRVSSRKGAVTLPLQVEKKVQKGHIHIPNGFGTQYPDAVTGELKTAGVNVMN